MALTPATRNREVYTPVSAILKHAGQEFKVRRPKGSRGRVITKWLWPEQAFRIFAAARSIDPEFAILLEQLCYTGPRLSEELRLKCDDVRLSESFVFLGNTKNGEPRPVHLPPFAVASLANHPRGLIGRASVYLNSARGETFIICSKPHAGLRAGCPGLLGLSSANANLGPSMSWTG
jgi:integrase